ncbi:MAG: alpha-mannosidase [candidate division KSB1 bacterium]|nr:alpha-mannosidase [candidate division KSB1 bacterium]
MRRVTVAVLALAVMGVLSPSHGQTPIRNWLVSGGFSGTNPDSMLDARYFPEEPGLVPVPGEAAPAGASPWQLVQADERGVVDLRRVPLPRHQSAVAYAVSYVYHPTATEALLLVGSDDGVAVWLNGVRVLRRPVYRGLGLDQDRVPVRLEQGWNHLVVKVFNGSGGFGYAVRLVDASGKDLPELVSVAEPPAALAAGKPAAPVALIKAELTPVASYLAGKPRVRLNVAVELATLLPAFEPGEVSLVVAGQKVQTRPLKAQLRNAVTFDLAHDNVRRLLGSGDKLVLEATVGGRKAERVFTVQPLEFLTDLFAQPDLPSPLRSCGERMTKVRENLRWAQVFSKGFQAPSGEFWRDLSLALLDGDLARFRSMLDEQAKRYAPLAKELKQNTIHLVGNAHIDMAWLWRYDPETIEVCRSTFASALNFAKEYPDFVYVQSQAQAYWWMEQRYPELFEEIRRAYQQGHWVPVGGMWVEPDLNLPSGEALARQILYGKRYFLQKLGADVVVGYNPDTFGYCWTLPQLYRKAGFKYFVTQKLRWNDTNPWEHDAFWWEAPDGSRVLALIPYGYTHDADPDAMAQEFVRFQGITGLKDHLVLYGVGNHGGGPTRQNLARIRYAQGLDVYPVVRHDDIQTVMEKIEQDPAARSLPVIRDELYLEYHRGTYTTQASIKKRNRRSEILMEEAEKLAVVSGIPYPSDELWECWRRVLLNQFHDILPGSAIPAAYEDAHRDYDFVEQSGKAIVARGLAALAAKVNTQGSGTPVLVFNPLSWTRTDIVVLDDPRLVQAGRVVDGAGKPVLSQVVGKKLYFLAEDVPALGYKVFWVRSGGPLAARTGLSVGPTTLENRKIRVEINPRNGNLKRVFDKAAGREVLSPGAEGNVLQAFGDLPDQYDAWNIGYTGEKWLVEDVEKIEIVDRGPLRASIRVVRKWRDSRFEQLYVLYAHSPRLDIETRADWHAEHVLLKALFPVNVQTDAVIYEIPYGTIARTNRPKTSVEKAKHEVPGHKFVDMSDGRWGVALLNDCKYGFDARNDSLRITLLRSPRTPVPIDAGPDYVPPLADQGSHEFTYSLYPHRGGYVDGGVARAGYELNYPMLVWATDAHTGDLPPSFGFVEELPENVFLTAVKKAEDAHHWILRMYELAGRHTTFSLRWHLPFAAAWEADLMEHARVKLPQEGEAVVVAMNPYEIKTILLERAQR